MITRQEIEEIFPDINKVDLLRVLEANGILEIITVKDLQIALVEKLREDLMLQENTPRINEERLAKITKTATFQRLLFKFFVEFQNTYRASSYNIAATTLDDLLEELIGTEQESGDEVAAKLSKEFYSLSEVPFLKEQSYEVIYKVTPEVGLVTKVEATFEIQMSGEEIISKAKTQFDSMRFSKERIYMYDDNLFAVRQLSMIPDGESRA